MKTITRALLFVLIGTVLLSCSDDEPDWWSSYSLPLKWETDFHAEWPDDNTLIVYANITPTYDNQQKSGLEAEIIISSRSSAEAPWEVFRTVHRSDGSSWHDSLIVQVDASDNNLHWYRIDTRIYFRNRLEQHYKGPIIATTRPLLRTSTAVTLPDLKLETPFESWYNHNYLSPAVAPDGQNLFIGDQVSRVFEISSGKQVRMSTVRCPSIQNDCYWHDNAIMLLDYGATIIDIEQLQRIHYVKGSLSFRRSDSEYVIIDRNSWLVYNPLKRTYTSIRAEFTIPLDSDMQPTTISQRPGRQEYLASSPERFPDIWWLYDETLTPLRRLGLIDGTELSYLTDMYPAYSPPSPGKGRIIWLDENRVLAPTVWSGYEEYWLCDLSSGTYRQVTGFNPAAFPSRENPADFWSRLPVLFPAYDATNDRLLVFFPIRETRCGVRALMNP